MGVAGAAIAAVVGVTGGILGIVAFTAESSAPQLLPPGPHELGGRVETLTETNASTAEAEGVPGSRPLPADQHAALPDIDPGTLIAAAGTYSQLGDGTRLEATLARLVQKAPENP